MSDHSATRAIRATEELPQGPVRGQVARAYSQAKESHEVIDELEKQLSPILAAKAETKPGNATRAVADCDLAERLLETNSVQSEANDRLRSILGRIQL